MPQHVSFARSGAAPIVPEGEHARRWSGAWLALPQVAATLAMSLPLFAASQNRDDPSDILMQTRQSVMQTVRQLPRYVCTQTVDRKRYEPADPEYGNNGTRRIRSCDDTVAAARRGAWKRRLASADRLRLDVAVTQDSPNLENEMYSWARENRFSDRDLFDFVREGAVSTGSFASMLASIFGNPAARFSYIGDSLHDGRMLSEFEYQISRDRSEYRYVFGEERAQQIAVAYDGTILVDPASADLVRLRVRTEQLPAETGACEVTQDLKYGRVHIGDGDFLLPAEADATIIHRDGTEAENRIQYSACHEFRGDSTVSFGDLAQTAGTAPHQKASLPPVSLPPGLALKVVFTDRIDMATAAAGDPIHGRLKGAIRDRSEKILVPEGAAVTGRIMRVQRSYNTSRSWAPERRSAHISLEPSLVIAVRLETLDMGKGPQPFHAAYDSGARRFVKQTGPFSARVDIGSLEDLHAAENQPATATFEFWENDPDHAIKSGLESNWITAAP
jgi:hypothetical protein